jgi:hypothetical protein
VSALTGPRTTYRLGDVPFSLEGDGPVLDALRRELSVCRSEEDQVLVRYRFVDSLPSLRAYSRVGAQEVADNACTAGNDRLRFRLSATATGWDVDVVAKPRASRAPALRRFADWNYLHPWEHTAKNFLYNIFDFSSQLAHLRQGSSYLHASTFTRGSRGVAVAAWGGIGKTTTMLKLVMEDGWRFLSDDLGLLRRDGALFRSPKWMQIYGYNLQGEPRLSRTLLSGRSLLDRLSWERRLRSAGPHRVRRRVSAEALFGEGGVARGGHLTDVFFLERTDDDRITSHPIDAVTCADRCATILLEELQPVTTLAIAQHATSRQPVLPPAEAFRVECRSVLQEAFSRTSLRAVHVPLGASPGDLATFFRKELRQ